ncbi:MAG TPA: DoxX family protein [Pedobacter sp.]|uniref:DoxX family protein n=1 Tax=Pedobacter sp. TaxID=1411316 RepID=UPI002D0EE9B2|nr:DoxX family protein [Pedobacter sp.]HMI01407.1 DoxX family protein [Pedobacter sp.]
MKKTNIFYWIITGIFAAFMLFTAIPDIMMSPDAVKMISGLGYPNYFIPFIGVAKVLGSIAILIPGFKSIKEWAYAGLFFDLFAATYSIIQTAGVSPSLLFMILPMVFLFVSYYLWHSRLKLAAH